MHAEVKKRCVTKGIKTLLPNKWNHGNGTKKKNNNNIISKSKHGKTSINC